MCFSAGASFGAAAVLGTTGIVSMTKTKSPSQLMFASMPFLFGVQQLCEGFEWLSFTNPDYEYLRSPMMFAFLTFAQIVWPSWVPISIWMMEPDKKRKKMMGVVALVGLVSSAILLYRMLAFPPVSDVEGHHVRYDFNSPGWIIYSSSIGYFISTLLAPLSSTLKYMKALGLIMFTALVVTEIFYEEYLVSVWCFFAALLSITILFVLQHSVVRLIDFHTSFHKRIGPDDMHHTL
jgi:hypothetical protein